MAAGSSRYYSKRMGTEHGLILDVMRQLRAEGHPYVSDNMRMAMEAFSAGNVKITRSGTVMGPAELQAYVEWASGHLERATGMDTAAARQLFTNVGTSTMRRIGKRSLVLAMAEPLTAGVVIEMGLAKSKVPLAPVRRRPKAEIAEKEFRPPIVDPGLETAPELPMPRGNVGGRLVYGYATTYKETHAWWKGASHRPSSCRGEELDKLLDVCEPYVVSRGWVPPPANKGIRDALAELEGQEYKGEAIVRPKTKYKPAAYISDKLWRIHSSGQYYAAKRERFLLPEEYCALYGWPMEHAAFDNLADEGAETDRVLWALTQGVIGTHASLMGDVAWAVNEAAGEKVKAEFRGVGINTVAMVWDVEKGDDSWDYVACYEGNPYVQWMHDVAWGTRHLCLYPRAEKKEKLPGGARVNTSVNSYRCQPWSYQNRTGINGLGSAMNERYAAYQAVVENKPNVIFDEMLCRSWQSGSRIAWTRVEFLRDLTMPGYCWAIVDCEAGNIDKNQVCSHREIVIGVLPAYKEIVEEVLVRRGYKKVPGAGRGGD